VPRRDATRRFRKFHLWLMNRQRKGPPSRTAPSRRRGFGSSAAQPAQLEETPTWRARGALKIGARPHRPPVGSGLGVVTGLGPRSPTDPQGAGVSSLIHRRVPTGISRAKCVLPQVRLGDFAISIRG
jgi:hypothetical protein